MLSSCAIMIDSEVTLYGANGICAGSDHLFFQGRTFALLDSAKMFVWLFDRGGEVSGVEIQICEDESLFEAYGNFRANEKLDWSSGFLTIWFSSNRSYELRSEPDWEDYYYGSEEKRLLIILKTGSLDERNKTRLGEISHTWNA